MMTNEKVNVGNDIPQPSNSAATVMVMGSVFLERFVFYASRMILVSFLMEQMGTVSTSTVYASNYMTLFLVPVILGLVLDFWVDFRLGIVMGAALSGLGLILLGVGTETTIFMGLAMLAIGSSAARLSNLSLMGYMLPQQAGKIDGGFTISWSLIQLTALLASGLMTWIAHAVGHAEMFVSIGVLALIHAAIVLILNGNGVLPSRSTIVGEQKMEPGGQLAGLLLMVGMVASAYLYPRWVERADMVTIGDFVIHVFAFLMIIVAFVVQASVPTRFAAQRSGAIGLLILVSLFFWELYELSYAAAYKYEFKMPSFGGLELDTMLMLFATSIVGVVLFLRYSSDPKGYRSSAVRILVGAGVGILGNLLFVMTGNEHRVSFVAVLALGAVAEALFSPTLYALVWRLSPGRRKATGLGMLMTSTGFSSVLGRLFVRDTLGDGEVSFLIMMGGIVLFAVLLIGVAVGVTFLLRNLADKERGAENPFA